MSSDKDVKNVVYRLCVDGTTLYIGCSENFLAQQCPIQILSCVFFGKDCEAHLSGSSLLEYFIGTYISKSAMLRAEITFCFYDCSDSDFAVSFEKNLLFKYKMTIGKLPLLNREQKKE